MYFLVDEFVEGRGNMIYRNRIISHPKNPIESSKSKCKTGFLRCLREKLVLDFHPAKVECITRYKPTKRAGAITNFKVCAVGFVRGGTGRVVFLVEEAGD